MGWQPANYQGLDNMAQVPANQLIDFVPGTPMKADEVDQNFNTIRVALNDTDSRVKALEGGTAQPIGPHASTHAAGGVDAISPASIGAATAAALNNHTASTSNPHGVTKAQVGLANLTNDAQVKRVEVGVANGVAPLDANSKIPAAHLPSGASGDAASIRGIPVNAAAPVAGQILKYNGTEYAPAADQLGSGGTGSGNLPTVGWNGDGVTDNRAAWAGMAAGHYFVPAGTYYVSAPSPLAAFTTPDNVVLEFARGAQIKVDAAYNDANRLAIQGIIRAGRWRIFQATRNQMLLYPGTTDAIYPEWWGAVEGYDGTVDNAPFITSALSAAPTYASMPVELGSGTYNTWQPVWASGGRSILQGVRGGRYQSSIIRGHHTGGPIVFVGSEQPNLGLRTGAALRTGTGSSMVTGGTAGSVRWVDLGQAPAAYFNGWTAFCMDFSFQAENETAADAWDHYIVTGEGRRTRSMAWDVATRMYVRSGTLHASLNIGGTVHNLSWARAGGFPSATLYHFALDYDGATLRLLADGEVRASVAATGAVTYPKDVNFYLGAGPTAEVYGGGLSNGPWKGRIDSFRISKVSRYAGPYTVPTAKHTADTNTQVLLNFDRQESVFTVGTGHTNQQRECWYPVLQTNFGNFAEGIEVHNLMLDAAAGAGGVYCHMASRSRLTSMRMINTSYGITGWNNNWLLYVDDMRIVLGNTGSSSWGIALLYKSGQVSMKDLDMETHNGIGMLMSDATGVVNHSYIGKCRLALLMSQGAALTAHQFTGVDEGSGTMGRGAVQTGIGCQFNMYSGMMESIENAVPNLTVDGSGQVALYGVHMRVNAGATERIRFLSAPTRPVIVFDAVHDAFNATNTDPTIPLTTTKQHVQDLSYGNMEAPDGMILRSPDGTRRRVTVDNTGALVVALA